MLRINSFYARSFDLDHINVFWELENDPNSDDIIAFEFILYKSESPGGPWSPVTAPFSNRFFFQDTTNPLQHKYRKIFYRLIVRHKVTSETKEFITSQIPEPDLQALEIIRLENKLFTNFVGRKCIVYPRKTFGARCTCWDNISGRAKHSNCMTCYGVTYLGGYLSPFVCYIQIDPSVKSAQPTVNIIHNPSISTARLISFPPINPLDIIIENENKRWIVLSVRTTERLRSPVHQELEIKEVLKSDIAYKLPTNIDILDVTNIAEDRNFTNPQTMRNDTHESYTNKPRGTIL